MSDNIVLSPYHLLLPKEIVSEILIKLPSKSLIRFKSVCKSWCDLVSNPQFLAKHLLSARDNNYMLLVKRRDNINKECVFSFLSDHNLTHLSQTRPLPFPEFPMDREYLRIEVDVEIMGYCNGLICLFYTDGVMCNYIVLWGPEDGKIKILPPSDVPNPAGFSSEATIVMPKLGFGYDPIDDYYRVIRMSLLEEDGYLFGHKVEIYSFKTDSWKGIDGFEIDYIEYRYAVCVNGVFLWWAKDRILWFRMSDESFGIIMPPIEMNSVAFRFDNLGEPLDTDYYGDGNNDPSWYKKLFVLNDQNFALVVYDRRRRMHKCFHVWVLLEFGTEESWTRLFAVGPLVRIERPVWFWEDGKIIMENIDGELILCDSFSSETKSVNICGAPNSLQIISITDQRQTDIYFNSEG